MVLEEDFSENTVNPLGIISCFGSGASCNAEFGISEPTVCVSRRE